MKNKIKKKMTKKVNGVLSILSILVYFNLEKQKMSNFCVQTLFVSPSEEQAGTMLS